jgi:hypothetical protein
MEARRKSRMPFPNRCEAAISPNFLPYKFTEKRMDCASRQKRPQGIKKFCLHGAIGPSVSLRSGISSLIRRTFGHGARTQAFDRQQPVKPSEFKCLQEQNVCVPR